MKKAILFILLAVISFPMEAQTLFHLKLDTYQQLESNGVMMYRKTKLPNMNATVVMGGLNDLDRMNNYFNILGSKLIIDSLDIGMDGTKKVVLRREDGRNIYNLFQTISAQLIPITQNENEM